MPSIATIAHQLVHGLWALKVTRRPDLDTPDPDTLDRGCPFQAPAPLLALGVSRPTKVPASPFAAARKATSARLKVKPTAPPSE